MTLGPVQLIVIEFENPQFTGKLLPSLRALHSEGAIRLLDMLAVRKDEKGTISAMQASDLTKEEAIRYGAIVGGLIGLGAEGPAGAKKGAKASVEAIATHDYGLAEDDIKRVTREIPKGHAAIIALIEHRWVLELKRAITAAGGVFFAEAMIQPKTLVRLGAELAAAGV